MIILYTATTQKGFFMKKTIYSLITLLALGSSLYAENIENIETSTVETTDSTLPIAQTIPLNDTMIQTNTTEVLNETNNENNTLIQADTTKVVANTSTTQEEPNIKNMSMTDTDGKSYSIKAAGNDIKIEGMEGKVVFIEFFGLNCPACKDYTPHLINLQEKYRDKFQVMAIEVQKHDVDPINAYKKSHNINYITLSNYDVGSMVRYVADKSGWTGSIPFTVAINAKGEVQFAQEGVLSEEKLAKYINLYSK